MTTTVVNIRPLPPNPADWPPDHVYIGRPMPARGLPDEGWGNPFRIDETMSRDDAVAAYDEYVRARPHLVSRVQRVLAGKTLVCWCAPEACHGDVLARLADEASS